MNLIAAWFLRFRRQRQLAQAQRDYDSARRKHQPRAHISRHIRLLKADQLAAECGKPRKRRAYNRRMAG